MDNKYYTPELEDLFIGYECEFNYFKDTYEHIKITSWYKFLFIWEQKILQDESIIDIPVGLSSKLRTPYLSKEDIESEGWVYKEDSFKRKFIEDKGEEYIPSHYWFVKNGYGLTFYPFNKTIEITDDRIHSMFPIVSYSGSCPSINEFRKICKWLNIK